MRLVNAIVSLFSFLLRGPHTPAGVALAATVHGERAGSLGDFAAGDLVGNYGGCTWQMYFPRR